MTSLASRGCAHVQHRLLDPSRSETQTPTLVIDADSDFDIAPNTKVPVPSCARATIACLHVILMCIVMCIVMCILMLSAYYLHVIFRRSVRIPIDEEEGKEESFSSRPHVSFLRVR